MPLSTYTWFECNFILVVQYHSFTLAHSFFCSIKTKSLCIKVNPPRLLISFLRHTYLYRVLFGWCIHYKIAIKIINLSVHHYGVHSMYQLSKLIFSMFQKFKNMLSSKIELVWYYFSYKAHWNNKEKCYTNRRYQLIIIFCCYQQNSVNNSPSLGEEWEFLSW